MIGYIRLLVLSHCQLAKTMAFTPWKEWNQANGKEYTPFASSSKRRDAEAWNAISAEVENSASALSSDRPPFSSVEYWAIDDAIYPWEARTRLWSSGWMDR